MTRNHTHQSLPPLHLISALCLMPLLSVGCGGESIQLQDDETSTSGDPTDGDTGSAGAPNTCEDKSYFNDVFSEPYAQCTVMTSSPDYVVAHFERLNHGQGNFTAPGQECRVCQPDYACEDDSDCPASKDASVSPSCIDNSCRITCETDSDCPSVLACVEDQRGEMTCALPRDPFGELDLVPEPGSDSSEGGRCEYQDCTALTNQQACEATLDAAQYHHRTGCVWIEERIFHDNGTTCEEEETRASCHAASFSPGAHTSDSACSTETMWADYGAGTVSLITSQRCDYALDADWVTFGDKSGQCDPDDPTRSAVCDCACE